MTDVHSKETRSYNMSRIRAKDTKPELLVRKYLFSKGFRYRLNVKKLPGKPDIVFTKYNTVIFINGCFWHGHENCPKARIPKTKTEWWKAKITKNQERDQQEYAALKQQGWRVLVVWECQLVPRKERRHFWPWKASSPGKYWILTENRIFMFRQNPVCHRLQSPQFHINLKKILLTNFRSIPDRSISHFNK